MIVRDLIERLRELPPDSPVYSYETVLVVLDADASRTAGHPVELATIPCPEPEIDGMGD